jgi:hypothetical protein
VGGDAVQGGLTFLLLLLLLLLRLPGDAFPWTYKTILMPSIALV